MRRFCASELGGYSEARSRRRASVYVSRLPLEALDEFGAVRPAECWLEQSNQLRNVDISLNKWLGHYELIVCFT